MSDADYRSFVGRIVFPKDTSSYPYKREIKKNGVVVNVITTYLLSVAAMNGPDQLIKPEFWDASVPDNIVPGELVYVSGKWHNEPYTDKNGDEQRPRQLNVNFYWRLPGEDEMAKFARTGTKAPARKRPVPAATGNIEDDFDGDF